MWYYAKDDNQHGPVDEHQLRQLVERGELQGDDLIWREGMEDWRPASELDQIAEGDVQGGQPPRPSPGSGDGESAGPRSTPPAPPPKPSLGERLAPAVSAAGSWTRGWRTRLAGKSGVLAGLLLVLLARGCESVSQHNVVRREALATLARSDFEAEYAALEAKLEARIDTLQEEGGRLEDLAEVENELTEVRQRRQTEQERLAATRWRKLREQADSAEARHHAASYWRQWLLLLGTAVLAASLTTVLATARDPAHRWLAVVLLAIVLWSLLVSGPWE